MNSKAKGNSFERLISKKLSLWVSNNEDDDLFYRTVSSGARFTQRKKVGKDTKNSEGDIMSTSEKTRVFTDTLVFECKNYKKLDLYSFISRKESNTYYGFWKELVENSRDSEKMPVLIAKEDYKDILFICDSDLSDRISFFFADDIPLKAEFIIEKERVCVYFFDDILSLNADCFSSLLRDACTLLFEPQ